MRNSEDRNHRPWLTPAQVALILGYLESPFREMAQLAWLTMMRLSEIQQLQRNDVRLVEGIISFSFPRNRAGRRSGVVLNTTAQRILQQQLDSHTSEWVFPDPRTG